MVAKISSGKSLRGALQYNENKVAKQQAVLIGQNGFQMEIKHLDFKNKIHRLENLAARNIRVKTNTLHVSLNFAPGENLPKEKLNEIAKDYMHGIGFGQQPFLVYQHKDAGHHHIHIVSTNIKADGSRISMHNLGRTKSEETRKALEKKYDLMPAEKINGQKQEFVIAKVDYGKCETKRAITNVVKTIIADYKFTSLPEFNVVLKNYNILADRGSADSRMFQKNGLLYWVMDKKGNRVGVPIKASSIYGSPTLKKLSICFDKNIEDRKPFKSQLKSILDNVLMTKVSKNGFQQTLKSKNIKVVFNQNKEGKLYGVTFIDYNNKTVFKGSDLGKNYSAGMLEKRFQNLETKQPLLSHESFKAQIKSDFQNRQTLLETMLESGHQDHTTFQGLGRKFRKKRKKKQSH